MILADEPVASLDPRTARSVLQYLRDATRELGIAVVCNLHQVDYAREFGDRIVGLSQGRMVFDGAPDQLGDAALNAIYHQVPAMAELQEQHTHARRQLDACQPHGRCDRRPVMSSTHMNPARHAVDGWQWTAARPDGKSGWLGMAAVALALAWVLH